MTAQTVEVPKSLVEAVAKKIKEEGCGGLLSITFPGWAREVFTGTLAAANQLGWSPPDVAIFALASFLEGNGYLVYTPPVETKPTLPVGVEDPLRQAMRLAVGGCDATTKKEKDEALDDVLVLLRAVLDGKTGVQG